MIFENINSKLENHIDICKENVKDKVVANEF